MSNKNNDIEILIEKKINFFQDIIQKTILHIQKNKLLEIIGVSEFNNCINVLYELSKKIKNLNVYKTTDSIIDELQQINNELSTLFKTFGTNSFEDLLWVCFGNNSVNTYAISDMDKHKFELLKKYFHPTSYRLLSNKNENHKSSKNDDNNNILNESEKIPVMPVVSNPDNIGYFNNNMRQQIKGIINNRPDITSEMKMKINNLLKKYQTCDSNDEFCKSGKKLILLKKN